MKSKKPVVIVLILIAAVVAYLALSDSSPKDIKIGTPKKDALKGSAGINYDSFTIIMDRLLGAGKWSAKDHQVGDDKTLTVNDLNFTLMESTSTQASTTDKVAPLSKTDSPSRPLMGHIATLEIKKGITKADLEAMLASSSWTGQQTLHLTEGISIKGFSLKLQPDSAKEASAKGMDQFNFTAENIAISGLRLAASDAKVPAGPASFLKALRFDSFGYENLVINGSTAFENSLESKFESKVAQFRITEFGFTGQSVPNLDTLDPSGLASVLSSFSFKDASTKGISLLLNGDHKGENKKVLITIASINDKNIQLGKVGESKISGIKLEINGQGGDPDVDTMLPFTFKLDTAELIGLDTQSYMNEILPLIITSAVSDTSNEDFFEAMNATQTLGDFFLSPVSLDKFLLKGMELKIGEQFSIALDESRFEGPVIEGTIPASATNTLKGVVITLNDDKNKVLGKFGNAVYKFGQDFGQTSFEIEAKSSGKYDAKTGDWSSKENQLTVKNLFKLTSTLEMSGMTTEQLKILNEIPMSSAIMALMAPKQVFGNIALNELSFKLVDDGLTERSMKYIYTILQEGYGAKDAQSSFKDFKEEAIVGVEASITYGIKPYLANSDVLNKSVRTFLTEPESLELSLKPSSPFNVESVMATEGDINKILNFLRLTVKANGEDTPPLVFSLPN